MLIRCKLIGTGVLGDEYRVPLPTYHLIVADYAGMRAIVNVPPVALPPALAAKYNLPALPTLQAAALQQDLTLFHAELAAYHAKTYINGDKLYPVEVV